MPTLAIIGAGSNLGAAVARRFAQEGFSVGLVSSTVGASVSGIVRGFPKFATS